jgi:hypothetical protein
VTIAIVFSIRISKKLFAKRFCLIFLCFRAALSQYQIGITIEKEEWKKEEICLGKYCAKIMLVKD